MQLLLVGVLCVFTPNLCKRACRTPCSRMPVQIHQQASAGRVVPFSSSAKPCIAGRSRVSTRGRSRTVAVLAASDKLALLSPSKVCAVAQLLHNSHCFLAFNCADTSLDYCFVQVNLFLRVVRRREDGYHDLASLFHVRPAGHTSLPRPAQPGLSRV